MISKDTLLARRLYLILGLLFITSLVVSNLIFKKFFYYYPFEGDFFGVKLFEISVGILPYPITFLITDLISEIYGKKKANEVVVGGIIASFFAMGIIYIANAAPATEWSPDLKGILAPNDIGAISNHLFGVKRSFASCKSLNNYFGIFVY